MEGHDVDELDFSSVDMNTELDSVFIQTNSTSTKSSENDVSAQLVAQNRDLKHASTQTCLHVPDDKTFTSPKYVPTYGPHQKFSRKFEESLHLEELAYIKCTKVICSLDILLEQFKGTCRHSGCLLTTCVEYSLCGTSATIRWKCTAGHQGRFCTSGDVNHVMMANNLQTAAAVLLSGNNFAKIEKLLSS